MSSSPKVNASNFDAAEFYVFASWLNHTKPASSSQVLNRTIIGRAYYAALICASSETGTSTHGPNGHLSVVNALRKKDLYAGNKLNDLRLKRQSADYKLSDVISSRDVETSLQAALAVLKALGKAPSPPAVSSNYLDSSKFACFQPQDKG